MIDKTFKELCKEFIVAERKMEEGDEYAETDDLSVLYRFICRDGWDRLANWRKRS